MTYFNYVKNYERSWGELKSILINLLNCWAILVGKLVANKKKNCFTMLRIPIDLSFIF